MIGFDRREQKVKALSEKLMSAQELFVGEMRVQWEVAGRKGR